MIAVANPCAFAAKGGRCAAPETSTGRAHGGAERFDRAGRIEIFENERRGCFRAGQDFEGDFGCDRERSERSGKAAREIIAGDILHDPAAGLENFAPARTPP